MHTTPLQTILAALASALATDSIPSLDELEKDIIGFREQVIVTPEGLGIRLWISVLQNGSVCTGWADYMNP